jgi:hypothetical protein
VDGLGNAYLGVHLSRTGADDSMSTSIKRNIERFENSTIKRVLKPTLEMVFVLVWFIYLIQVIANQNYDDNLTFDLFLARIGGPTASHATTFLIFLSIFPIAWVLLRSIIAGFLVEALAFDIHEGMWQLAYLIAWHSTADWHVWLVENAPDTVTTLLTVAVLVYVYRFPARFFIAVTVAWGCFLVAWLAIGFPVTVLSKLSGYQVIPSVYNTTLWVNQVEFLSWLYFAVILLAFLTYFVKPRMARTSRPLGGIKDDDEPKAER